MESVEGVAHFFRDRSVLVTGGTGFMGKVLVEKLLRSCPELRAVYLMMRAKKGMTPAERLTAMYGLALFDRLKDEQPHATDKIIPVTGDIMELGLGLSDEDRHTLEQEVSVVFHVAATVRFDDPIQSAVFMNVRGTRDVLELASNMPQLKAMMHVSTTYSNTEQLEIGEAIYPPPGDWRKVVEACETMDPNLLQILSPKILGFKPNTYAYTKALGEHVVNDYRHTLPVVILRPSIVISTRTEPVPGWLDNFNGPVGLMVAGGKGILRIVWADPDISNDYMAVDVAVKSFIVAAWAKGTAPQSSVEEVPVYNCSSSSVKGLTLREINTKAHSLTFHIPLNNGLWAPGGDVTRHFSVFYVKAMLLHILPALLVDSVLYLMNKKPMLLRLQRRIYIAMVALKYFTHHGWHIPNDRFLALERSVLPSDRDDWGFDFSDINIHDYIRDSFIGARQYLLKESLSSLPSARRHFTRMYWLDKIVRGTAALLFACFVYSRGYVPAAWATLTGYLEAFSLE